MNKTYNDTRDAVFEELYEIALGDPSVVVLAADTGALMFKDFKRNIPKQFFNTGVAEQNTVSVAAGLALVGKHVFVFGISNFVTLRCYEQIKIDLCCMNLPVTIIGSGPGYTYGSDGPTHHATQDVAIMRTLPEMTILNPSDATATAAFARLAYENTGPTYIRLEKGVLPSLYDDTQDFNQGFQELKNGRELIIVSTGVMTHRALKVAEELAKHSVAVGVIDLYRMKPVNSESLLSVLRGAQWLVTLEESSVLGGLGSLISELLVDAGEAIPLKRLGAPDVHTYQYGPREWLHSQHGLDVDSLVKVIFAWLRAKS